MSAQTPCLAVIGAACSDQRLDRLAAETGRLIAAAGALLLCGGRGGVMAAAAAGAKEAGGRTVGVLPGKDRLQSPPNAHIDLALFTGMGQARNLVLVLSADAVIAIGGGWGTLSEIALARKHGRPTILLDSWTPIEPGGEPAGDLVYAQTAKEAVAAALAAFAADASRNDRRSRS